MTNTLNKNINWLTAKSHLENITEDASAEWPLKESLNEPSNDKKSISKSKNQKQLNKLPKLKKISNHGATSPDITNQYDLYHKATSVNYIKDKYDAYSNWLAKNNKKPAVLNSKDKNIGDQLSWYEFQKSVYANEQNCFRYEII